MSDFSQVAAPTQPNDFAQVAPEQASPTGATPGPLTARIASLATAPDAETGVQPQNIDATDTALQAGQEYHMRMQVAMARQQRQLQNINAMKPDDKLNMGITTADSQHADAVYNNIAQQSVVDNAKTSLEREAIERIQDHLTEGNPVEAKLTYNLMFGTGDATKVWNDEAVKNLILAQKMEQYQTEAENESWPKSIYNFLTGLVPLNDNFANTGIVPGTESNYKTFLLSGTARQQQGEAMWNKYRTGEDFSAALVNGGELDAGLRSNATTFGSYDPRMASSLLAGLAYQTDSDRLWANGWSLANVGMLVPWAKAGSIPGALMKLGSRSAARNAVADAVEQIISKGPIDAAKATGISEAETVGHLETTALNPNAGNAARVPLTADVDAHLKTLDQVRQRLPEVLGPSAYTNPAELRAAAENTLKEVAATTGRPVKDVEHWFEDSATKERTPYKLGDDLPEQGNGVFGVTVTLGKTDGGGFATIKSALTNLKTKLGLDPQIVSSGEQVAVDNAAAGFTDRAYHGTGRSFGEFDPARAGEATGAENTRGGVTFFSDDPDVAHSYAKVGAAKDNHAEMERLREAALKPTSTDAEVDAYSDAVERALDDAGANIRPVDLNTKNFYEADMAGRSYNGPETQAIIDTAKAQGKDGVIFRNYDDDLLGGKLSTTYAVFNHDVVRSAIEPKIMRDVSGQYFGKADFHIKGEGFRTTPLKTPEGNFLSPMRSDARRMDADLHGKAVSAGANTSHLTEAIALKMKNAVKGIGKEDKLYLDEIIRKGQNDSQWYTDHGFNMIYERATGKLPEQKVLDAYHAYWEANDADFILRRDNIWQGMVDKGHEHVSFDLGKTKTSYEGPGRVKIGGRAPEGRIFNATDGINYGPKNPLTKDEFERLSGEGYLRIDTKEPVRLPNGERTNTVLVKRTDIERRALSRDDVLGYKAGGHRAYTGKYFLKQAVEGVQPDGARFFDNPNVFRAGDNPNILRAWAKRFNQAIEDAKGGNLDPQHFDDNVFANNEGLSFPSGQEFVDSFNAGKIDKRHPVELTGDREMPSAYIGNKNGYEHLYDPEESSHVGYYRTTGRLYTSGKGEVLKDASGELAATVDPWETTNTALQNISRLSSFDNYKINALERFKATYGQFLKLNDIESASPSEIIKSGIRDDTPYGLHRQIAAEQGSISRILNFETDFEKNARHAIRETAEWVLGDATSGPRVMAHDAVYWLSKNNPVNFLRGLAFDAKLGFFNAGQMVLQSATMLVSAALSPAHGMKGMFGSLPMFAFAQSKGSEAVLDVLAKNGAWKIASFESEQEFKNFSRFMYKIGFLDPKGTHLTVNDFHPNRVFGAASKFDAIREAGRAFFYKAEIMNRSVAGRIAWEELKSHGAVLGSAAFRENFMRIADDYSMNMMSQSSAQFQKGLWSIPTQFWGYNIRMMDAMFGKRFTAAQKSRLIASQAVLWGAAGVPGLDALNEIYKNSTGQPAQTGSISSVIDRGVVDNALAAVTGADVRVGERVGVNTSFIKDIFGMGDFGVKSAMDILGGATFTISTQAGKTLADVVRYGTAEMPQGAGNMPLTRDSLLKLADNVSTFSNVSKAIMVANYGIYKSNKGAIQATDVPTADAFAIALGMQPQEMDNIALMSRYTKDNSDTVKDAANQLRSWRQEAFTNPDTYEENMKKANALMTLLPPSVRVQAWKSSKFKDDSVYDHIANKYNIERMNEEADGESVNNTQ